MSNNDDIQQQEQEYSQKLIRAVKDYYDGHPLKLPEPPKHWNVSENVSKGRSVIDGS